MTSIFFSGEIMKKSLKELVEELISAEDLSLIALTDALNTASVVKNYPKFVQDHMNDCDGDHRAVISNMSMGLAGESGEFIDHVKKYLYHGHDIDHEYVRKELGDILWYVVALMNCFDQDLIDVMEKNKEKLQNRYKSGGFSKEESRDREETKESDMGPLFNWKRKLSSAEDLSEKIDEYQQSNDVDSD